MCTCGKYLPRKGNVSFVSSALELSQIMRAYTSAPGSGGNQRKYCLSVGRAFTFSLLTFSPFERSVTISKVNRFNRFWFNFPLPCRFGKPARFCGKSSMVFGSEVQLSEQNTVFLRILTKIIFKRRTVFFSSTVFGSCDTSTGFRLRQGYDGTSSVTNNHTACSGR
jgi:hypothetical protein